MWRIPSAPSAKLDGIRITSTCVENTNLLKAPSAPLKDHLHIRGEYKDTEKKFLKVLGSPPHTWRILNSCTITSHMLRITSTYVENTLIWSVLYRCYQDHLHIRGEYDKTQIYFVASMGSPPHTWRIQPWHKRWWIYLRITSTYVENTINYKRGHGDNRDHLHIRGEYRLDAIFVTLIEGSPPHTWRIPSKSKKPLPKEGITSTYVENTKIRIFPLNSYWDHLHIRGEYLKLSHYLHPRKGSPPHTWRILWKFQDST